MLDQPDQQWQIMIAKRNNDLCVRGAQIYKNLEQKFHPKVRFGYIDIYQDEALKVAFGEEDVPMSFGIINGTAYKFYALENTEKMTEYWNDISRWDIMRVQFPVP